MLMISGFLVTPLLSGCRLGYVTHTDPKGRLPTWVSNKLSTSFAPKLARRLHKACLKYEAWKRGNSWKPWLFPEQTLDAPRINLKDVSLFVGYDRYGNETRKRRGVLICPKRT